MLLFWCYCILLGAVQTQAASTSDAGLALDQQNRPISRALGNSNSSSSSSQALTRERRQAAGSTADPGGAYDCLAEHNKLRARHGVPPLVWDAALAQYAHWRSNDMLQKNYFNHISGNPHGENLYMQWGAGGFNCQRMVRGWYDEIRLYNYQRPGFAMGTGHFTQLVWRNSRRLGCAFARGGRQYLSCEYSPPGNVIGNFPANVPPPNGNSGGPSEPGQGGAPGGPPSNGGNPQNPRDPDAYWPIGPNDERDPEGNPQPGGTDPNLIPANPGGGPGGGNPGAGGSGGIPSLDDLFRLLGGLGGGSGGGGNGASSGGLDGTGGLGGGGPTPGGGQDPPLGPQIPNPQPTVRPPNPRPGNGTIPSRPFPTTPPYRPPPNVSNKPPPPPRRTTTSKRPRPWEKKSPTPAPYQPPWMRTKPPRPPYSVGTLPPKTPRPPYRPPPPRPPYGRPPYVQPPYGRPPYGRPPYGRPPWPRPPPPYGPVINWQTPRPKPRPRPRPKTRTWFAGDPTGNFDSYYY